MALNNFPVSLLEHQSNANAYLYVYQYRSGVYTDEYVFEFMYVVQTCGNV